MAHAETHYAASDTGSGFLKITFMRDGVMLTRSFDSEYLARQFFNKVKRSKRCRLVSYPQFK